MCTLHKAMIYKPTAMHVTLSVIVVCTIDIPITLSRSLIFTYNWLYRQWAYNLEVKTPYSVLNVIQIWYLIIFG